MLSLFLWVPGVMLPAMHLEKVGRIRETSLLDSFHILIEEREWLLAAVVGLSALLLPPIKLLVILCFDLADPPKGKISFRQVAVEIISRFGLLEVFITAIFVAQLRLDALVSFQVRFGLYLFILSAMIGIASLLFLHLHRHSLEPTP